MWAQVCTVPSGARAVGRITQDTYLSFPFSYTHTAQFKVFIQLKQLECLYSLGRRYLSGFVGALATSTSPGPQFIRTSLISGHINLSSSL